MKGLERKAINMTKVEAANALQARPRTSEGLRDVLFDTLERLNAGSVTAQEAQAVCKVCAQIINSVNTEIEFFKHIGRHHEKDATPRTILTLGAEAAASH